MILKAGTYRFNDVLTNFPTRADVDELFNNGVNFDFISGEFDFNYMCYGVVDGQTVLIYANTTTSIQIPAYTDGFEDETYKGITFTKDIEVVDDFGTTFIANTNYNEVNAKPLATIEYNGQTIAQLNAGEMATLSCEGMKMASDVVVKVNKIEEPKDDSIVGTWVFKENIEESDVEGIISLNDYVILPLDFKMLNLSGVEKTFKFIDLSYFDYLYFCPWYYDSEWKRGNCNDDGSWDVDSESGRTFTVTKDTTDTLAKKVIKAIATKQ